MEKSKQIQIGLLGLIVVLLLANLFGGGSLFGGASSDDARDAARQRLAVTNPTAPTATTPTAPAAPPVPVGPTTNMEFAESTFDFGSVDEGEKVSHTYKFKNTGNEPLIITDAKGSCGCTVPSKPTEPIAPGDSGEITVVFDSKNKKGARNQSVTVTANTNPPQTIIHLKGEVIPAAGSATPAKPTPAPSKK